MTARLATIGSFFITAMGFGAGYFADDPIVKTAGWIAGGAFFLFFPYYRYSRIEDRLRPKLEINGEPCLIPNEQPKIVNVYEGLEAEQNTYADCCLRIENNSPKTIEDVRIEVMACQHPVGFAGSGAFNNFKFPAILMPDSPTDRSINPGFPLSRRLFEARIDERDYENDQSNNPNSHVVYARITSSNWGQSGFLEFEIGEKYILNIKVTGKDTPCKEAAFYLVFLGDKHNCLFTLEPV